MFIFIFFTGTACGADFYSSSLDKSDSPEAVSDANTPSSARRSQRGGGKKPDYYDALEIDTKRKRPGLGPSTPTRTGKRFAGKEKIFFRKNVKILVISTKYLEFQCDSFF